MAEKRPLDTVEEEKVEQFYREGCGCKLGVDGSQCYRSLSKEDIEQLRNWVMELEQKERDMVILSFLIFNKPRCGERTTFYIYGRKMCRKAFLFCLAMSLKLLTTLSKHLEENGLVARCHGNTNRQPHNASSLETKESALNFIRNFATENAVVLPGRVAHHKDENSKLLLIPSSETKGSVFHQYRDLCQESDMPSLGFSAFCDLWNKQLPYVKIAKPMTDLCWTCQKSNAMLLRSHIDQTEEHGGLMEQHMAHIRHATEECRYYRAQVEKAQESITTVFDPFSKHTPCSFDGMAHYSWDYAQQTHYPLNPLQPGPIFFKTPRKCGIFGICNDGINLQYNYLIDEINSTGKGANATISYLHHFLEKYGMGETNAYLHADNCSGQNKNNAFVFYLMWRILNGLHKTIEYSFMIAGHTKFSCDRCFGTFKKKLKETPTSSLYEIAEVCDNSGSCNFSVLVGSHDMKINVPTYDWSDHFNTLDFKAIPNMLDYHHFRMSDQEPGMVTCLKSLDVEEEAIKICIMKEIPAILPPKFQKLPEIVPPKGLSEARKRYLYTDIRQFCTSGTEDLVAPSPDI